MPTALAVLPGAALHFNLYGQVLILLADLGTAHDAIPVLWMAVRVSGRRHHDCFDDGEIVFVRAYLLRGLNAAGEPQRSCFLCLRFFLSWSDS